MRSMVRHVLNNRRNAVARQRYVENILQFGVMSEMRARRACMPGLGSCRCRQDGSRDAGQCCTGTGTDALLQVGTISAGLCAVMVALQLPRAAGPSCTLAPGRASGDRCCKHAWTSGDLGTGICCRVRKQWACAARQAGRTACASLTHMATSAGTCSPAARWSRRRIRHARSGRRRSRCRRASLDPTQCIVSGPSGGRCEAGQTDQARRHASG